MLSEIISSAVTRAKADASIASIVGSKVYNNIPKDQSPPYLRIHIVDAEELPHKDSDHFFSLTLRFDFWTEDRGDKSSLQMIDYITDEFHKQELVLNSGKTNLIIRRTNFLTFLESDGLSRHGVVDFNLTMEG